MRGDFDEDEEDDDYLLEDLIFGGGGGCPRCYGEGVIVVCIDDMCRGAGECIHGDGEIVCPVCGGE